MLKIKSLMLAAVLTASTALSASAATSKAELNTDSNQAIQALLKSNPNAADVAKRAKAILVFPNIVKAGLVFGGAYGEGELKEGEAVKGYYNSISASWGLQAGAQTYGYVVFLMNDKAVNYINKSAGWEIGTDPSIAVANVGAGKNISTTSEQKDAYAYVFNQQGLMATLSLEGTKISRISNP